MLRFVLPLVALSSRALAGDDDDHAGHDHDVDEEAMLALPLCACMAEDMDFEINCAKPDAVKAAYDKVVACSGCSSDDCIKNWAIVETHHDLCFHDEIPKEVEVGFHDLEEKCEHACLVGRKKEKGMSECATVDCDKSDTVLGALSFDGCAASCTAECGAAYATLRGFHDQCAEGIAMEFEKLIHDLEEPCEDYNCWVDSSHCAPTNGKDVNTLKVLELKERGLDKCEMTEAEAKVCIRDPKEKDESAAFGAVFLAYFLW
jgi:hypothetical protein